MTAVIEVSGLHKAYGSTVAVDGVSFDVEQTEIFGILGPNGAGKTTTVECLQGLRRADRGRLRVLGLDPWADAEALRRRIGSQLQQSALPDRIRVAEALDLFASFARGSSPWRDLMTQWGIADKADAAFASLSGGQRQRLFIALALVNDPEVVFLDEMTAGLDPAARRVAWDLIRRVRERGKTVVLVTHFMDEAERLCDRVTIIDRGKVRALGAPQQLIATHSGGMRIKFTCSVQDISWLNPISHVRSVVRNGPLVEVQGTGPVLSLVAAALVDHGIQPEDLRVEQPTLEDVFLKLTAEQSAGESAGPRGEGAGPRGEGTGSRGEDVRLR